jgi:hypothetical protein
MEIPPDTLEAVGVNDLFVEVTVDESFTTEQTVVGHIDEVHILITVRTATIVGYLSPTQICDVCVLLHVRKLDMEMSPDSLEDFLTKAGRVSDPWCLPTSSRGSPVPALTGEVVHRYGPMTKWYRITGRDHRPVTRLIPVYGVLEMFVHYKRQNER